MKLNVKNLKLIDIPKIFYLNNDDNLDRKEFMESQFYDWDITNFERISTSKYSDHNYDEWKDVLDECELTISKDIISRTFNHLKTIVDWYDNHSDPYCIIMEDNVDISTAEYWMFDWKTLMNNLPYNWDCVSLITIVPNIEVKQLGYTTLKKEIVDELKTSQKYSTTCTIPMHLKPHDDSKGCVYCYIITRHFAKKIKQLHVEGGKYKLFVNSKNTKLLKCDYGTLDTFLYDLGISYTLPVFNVNKKFLDDSSTEDDKNYFELLVEQMSSDAIEYWWSERSKLFSTYEFFTYNKRFDWQMETTFDVTKKQIFKQRIPKNTILWI